MKVVHVSRFFHPHRGGTETFIASLIEATRPLGVEPTVLCTSRRATGDGPAPDARVSRVNAFGPDFFPVPARPSEVRRIYDGADVIHLHDLRFLVEFSTAYRLLTSKPVVLSTHGLVFHTRRYRLIKESLWRTYYAAAFRSLSTVVCDSREDLRRCSQLKLRALRYLPNGVDTSEFEEIPPAVGRPGSLLYFGRVASNKGVERLVPLLEAEPTWTLTVAGVVDPRLVGTLRDAFAPVASRVSFEGAVTSHRLRELLAGHGCVVLPSRAEGFGITLVEALASGRPVVASAIPTYTEIGEGSPARLVDFDDVPAAVGACGAAMASWNADRAQARAAEFSWASRSQEWARLYTQVAAE